MLAPLAGAALAVECRDAEDAQAAHLRWLQTRLMVAALSCQGSGIYNEFVGKFKGELDWSVKRMDQMFARDHGRLAAAQYNQFNTGLANAASSERTTLDRNYCTASEIVYLEALAKPPQQLLAYAVVRPARPGVLPTSCTSESMLAQKR